MLGYSKNLPFQTISPSFLEIPKNISLTDPKFFQSSEIDLLIGAGSFWKLLCIGQVISPRDVTSRRLTLDLLRGALLEIPSSIIQPPVIWRQH
jgi:hypothetical protein